MPLPGGVFQSYSGGGTSVLLFRTGGRSECVLFLHADGYRPVANHDPPIEAAIPVEIDALTERLWEAAAA